VFVIRSIVKPRGRFARETTEGAGKTNKKYNRFFAAQWKKKNNKKNFGGILLNK